MTTIEISYKDLDTHGHFSVQDVEKVLIEQHNVPVIMTRVQYVHYAKTIMGLHRVLHNRPDELIGRDKLAREFTRHLNWNYLHPDDRPQQQDDDEKTERFWK